MPNRQNSSGSQSQDRKKPLRQSQDSGKNPQQWQGTSDEEDERNESPDNVEIGDPVPENQRTVRATRGAGETGEDEDLPSDDGGIEGTRSERH